MSQVFISYDRTDFAFVEFPGVKIDFMSADNGFLNIPFAAIRQSPTARRAFDNAFDNALGDNLRFLR